MDDMPMGAAPGDTGATQDPGAGDAGAKCATCDHADHPGSKCAECECGAEHAGDTGMAGGEAPAPEAPAGDQPAGDEPAGQ